MTRRWVGHGPVHPTVPSTNFAGALAHYRPSTFRVVHGLGFTSPQRAVCIQHGALWACWRSTNEGKALINPTASSADDRHLNFAMSCTDPPTDPPTTKEYHQGVPKSK